MGAQANDTTAAIMDGILRFVAAGGFITTALVAPNAVQVFDKPLMKMLNTLDKRQQQRELRRVMHYMKLKGLIKYEPRDYEHGISLTRAGKQKLKKRDFDMMTIPAPEHWDGMWRLVFFDIPENERTKRNSLNLKLKQLGFKQLQISIWIYPFACRAEIEATCEVLDIRKYVTYVEIANIDNEKSLRQRFRHLIAP